MKAVSISCAKGSIACPAIAGKESIISSVWTLCRPDGLVTGLLDDSLRNENRFFTIFHFIYYKGQTSCAKLPYVGFGGYFDPLL